MNILKQCIGLTVAAGLAACVNNSNREGSSELIAENNQPEAGQEITGNQESKLICTSVYITGSHRKERRCVSRTMQQREEEEVDAWRRQTRSTGNSSTSGVLTGQ